MAGQIYVKLDGIDGGSQDDNEGHKNSFFEAESFDFGGSINFDQDAQRVTGRANYDLATFTMKHDRMLATLFTKMNEKALIAEVIIHWISSAEDGTDAKFMDMKLENATIVAVSSSLQDEGGEAMNSMISVTLAYSRYELETSDSFGAAVSANYDLRARTA